MQRGKFQENREIGGEKEGQQKKQKEREKERENTWSLKVQ